jgi:trans-aconitate 2-methyltransferase
MSDEQTTDWQPTDYLKFGKERTQPSVDLVSRIALPDARRILDIGCGPGNSTAVLRSRWPKAELTGIDSSPEMIEKAKSDHASGKWVVADYRNWDAGETYDLVFSNATIHWIPDHERLFAKMFAMTSNGGAVAAQVPSVQDSAVHQAARRLSQTDEWREILAANESALTYHPATYYYQLLSKLSRQVELWHTTYYHIMESHEQIIEWYSSTGLKAYLSLIPGDEGKQRFKREVLEASAESYPALEDGKIMFPFKRLFMLAYK